MMIHVGKRCFKKLWAVLLLWGVILLCPVISAEAAQSSGNGNTAARSTAVTYKKTGSGTWVIKGSKVYFRDQKNRLIRKTWKKIDGKNYYFDAKGVRKSGWFLYKGKTYFLNKDGHMQTGWLSMTGKKYYFSKKGIMQKGFLHIGSNWFYANTKTGIIRTGWAKINGKRYYFRKTGTMKTGWLSINGKRYYFTGSGVMVTGNYTIKGKKYLFNSDGTLNKSAGQTTVKPKGKMVALTFDDGPSQYTRTLLNTLEQYHAKATFFMVGENVSNYSSTVRKMYQIGCELGNHTYNHSRLTSLSVSQIQYQISRTNERIKAITGVNPTVMRPPYGSYNSTVLNYAGLPAVYWSIDPRDWDTLNTYSTVAHIKQNVRDGSIILIHDIYSSSVQAAIQLIPWLSQQGYQMVTVSEMGRYRLGGLKNGSIYFNMYP
ncbi:MAG: polysaccharide deacetylase family protein [Lachnospiraceae bacterium]|nr:polysaccharide deacetylase family protein [Lachnospiraceae bacterium]